MTPTDVKEFIRSLGLDCVGIAPAILPKPSYEENICPLAAGHGPERYNPQALLANCQSIIVILFPYFNGIPNHHNISIYAQTRDYHLVIKDYLTQVQAFLESLCPASRQVLCADTSPLADRWLAYQAGLGFIGDNYCFINPTYGSFCYIGSILTTLCLEPDQPLAAECQHCGACRKACLGNCLNDTTFHYENCKSYLTQKKGSLTLPEQTIIAKSPLIYGCDECQKVCPHNHDIPLTPIPAFRENRSVWLERNDIEGLSNRQFQQKYGDCAFSWRGKKILLRNMDYTKQT